MAIVRNRAMMPSVMSMATEIAVPGTAPAMVSSRMPGHDVGEVRRAAGAAAAQQPAPERAAEDVDEEQQEDDRRADERSA